MMKAIYQHEYGSPEVLELVDTDQPTPGHGEALVRVHAASLDAGLWHFVRGLPYVLRLTDGLRRPKHKIPGRELAGRVESVGGGVTELRPGDEVFGEISGGACAEYVSAPCSALVVKPASLTFEHAATVGVSACTALQALRDHASVQHGQSVLINGASGGVGTFAVQVAKALGAEVTGVCGARNMDTVRAIGADRVIDYASGDFTSGDVRYDAIVDLVGNRSLSECRRVLKPDAAFVAVSGPNGIWLGPLGYMFKTVLQAPFVSQRVRTFVASPSTNDLRYLKELIEVGAISPVIDRRFALSETPDAIRYLESGHASGKIVIDVHDSAQGGEVAKRE